MIRAAALSAALVAGLFVVGCSGSDDGDSADMNAAASTVGTVANVKVPFCAPGEKTILSCATTNNKMLSVCAKNVTSPNGYIEYRFGPANRAEATFAYPNSYMDDSEPEVTSYALNFKNGAVTYQVFSMSGNNIDGEGHDGQAGVKVWNGDDLQATIFCASHERQDLDIDTVREARVPNQPIDAP